MSHGCTNTDYWYFEEPELDNYLAKFWLCVWKEEDSDSDESDIEQQNKKDNKYSANSLRNFPYALNRILRTKGHLYNITETEKGTSFLKCNEAFKVAIRELKSEGNAEVKSYSEINEDGKHVNKVFFAFLLAVNAKCQLWYRWAFWQYLDITNWYQTKVNQN